MAKRRQIRTTDVARRLGGISNKWAIELAEKHGVRIVRTPLGRLYDADDVDKLARKMNRKAAK